MRSRHLIVLDLATITAAFVLAFVLRFETFAAAWISLLRYDFAIVPFAVIKLVALYRSGLYHRIWRYASTPEATTIVSAMAISSLVISALVLVLGWSPLSIAAFEGFPRSVLGIDLLLSIAFIGGTRFALRLLGEAYVASASTALKSADGASRRVLIAGAGDAGVLIAREMKANPGLGMRPVGFADDDPRKQGHEIVGIPVLGRCSQIEMLVEQHGADEVLIAMPTVPGQRIRALIETCRIAGVPCRTIPGIYELIDGRVSLSQTREIRIEDLLRREPAELDDAAVVAAFADRTVLITGGGGSIGSELSRQIALCRPARIVLFGHGENSIFEAVSAFKALYRDVPVVPVIGSVCDRERVAEALRTYRPDVVFHAAAHKHVGLMEANPVEAVKNNVFGTRVVCEESAAAGVGRFVLISTDKAVNPTSVMGATKRLAELTVQGMAGRSDTIFTAVRFGNVLGSRGSVVPILRRQIAAGGPVTVTHPEVTRFFMTIPEAAKLVVHAAVIACGGEIFVLDMGPAMLVLDLARDVIQLSGLKPEEDIPIVFTGLAPGEKLHEDLVRSDERLLPTRVPGIRSVESPRVEAATFRAALGELEAAAQNRRDDLVRSILMEVAEWPRATSPTTPRAADNGHLPTYRPAPV